jgi:hypothetical protein
VVVEQSNCCCSCEAGNRNFTSPKMIARQASRSGYGHMIAKRVMPSLSTPIHSSL